MKVQLASIALTVLAGAITASGQPQERRQKSQRRPNAVCGQQQSACPTCGVQRQQQFRRGQCPEENAQARRGQQQFRPQDQPQFKGRDRRQSSQQHSPQQRQHMQQMRKLLMERCDRDGDGQLSEREWQSLKRTISQPNREPKRPVQKNQKKPDQQPKRQRTE